MNRVVEFHVTSLDVAHSFWAIELGVKADAIQGADNVAYATALQTGSFQVRCDELCGLWHGHMNTTGHVVTARRFATWIARQQRQYAGVTKVPAAVLARSITHNRHGMRADMEAASVSVSRTRSATPSAWRQLLGFNIVWAIALGDRRLRARPLARDADRRATRTRRARPTQDDVAILIGPRLRDARLDASASASSTTRSGGSSAARRRCASARSTAPWRYFRLCTDHKVVAIQYLVAVLFFFFVAGLNAMFIRGELTSDNATFIPAGNYLTLVGLHGTMMLMMMSAGVLGPLGNYLVPLMIGARRMAFPRIESLTMWLTVLAGFVLLSAILLGGFPTGWTGYAPLADQARAGIDAYIVSFALIGISLALVGLNMIATVMTMRAPGMTWNRLPIFVWGMVTTSILALLAAPVLLAALIMVVLRSRDRHLVLHLVDRRQPVPVGRAVLVLRPSRGLHPRAARLRDRARDPAGVRAQAAVGLPARGRRHVRRRAAELHGLAAPPVHERHQLEPAAVLHVQHRADLDPDRGDLPQRDGDAVEGADPLHRADAVRARVLLQLPDRRALGRVPVGRHRAT